MLGRKPKPAPPPSAPSATVRGTLGVEKHCEFLTAHIRDKSAEITDSFKLYVQVYAGLLGGTLLLKKDPGHIDLSRLAFYSQWLASAISVTAIVAIVTTTLSWLAFREALSQVAGLDPEGAPIVPRPDHMKAMRMQAAMVLVILVTWVGFLTHNPLYG